MPGLDSGISSAARDGWIKSGHDGEAGSSPLEQVPASLNRHSRESGNPGLRSFGRPWTPAFAGLTGECNWERNLLQPLAQAGSGWSRCYFPNQSVMSKNTACGQLGPLSWMLS